MVYRAIGLMSGSSMDGLDIAFVEFHENGGKWAFDIQAADCYAYPDEWAGRLKTATELSAKDYQLLHCDYGRYLGESVNKFIAEHGLQFRIALIGSHGHTTFHDPARGMTAQLGDGGSIAAVTGLPVVSDLRVIDVALGGQGAPIVPIGERLLLNQYQWFLNIGGIANISSNGNSYEAFDVCAANRVLNLLSAEAGKPYDDGGAIAASGSINQELLNELNKLEYYNLEGPKSLANDFGTDVVFPLIQSKGISITDALSTYTQHIVEQVSRSIRQVKGKIQGASANNSGTDDFAQPNASVAPLQLLVTGGGAYNTTLINGLKKALEDLKIEVVVPSDNLIQYKEAMIMALIGVLRWREEVNVFSSVTGAKRDSVGGAMWMGEG